MADTDKALRFMAEMVEKGEDMDFSKVMGSATDGEISLSDAFTLIRAQTMLSEKRDQSFAEKRAPATYRGLFASTDEQLLLVKTRNKLRRWGFGDSDFQSLPPAPEWPDKPLAAVVLVPYLATVRQTLEELWLMACDGQRKTFRRDDALSAQGQLKLVEGATHVPGLCWEVIDLDACRNADILELGWPPERLPHAGIMAAAAHFPVWIRSINRGNAPIIMPGYRSRKSRLDDSQDHLYIPELDFDHYMLGFVLDEYVHLGINTHHAIPAILESRR